MTVTILPSPSLVLASRSPRRQELLREANTLGSKAAALELTNISVEMKVAIEQLREQVQNLE